MSVSTTTERLRTAVQFAASEAKEACDAEFVGLARYAYQVAIVRMVRAVDELLDMEDDGAGTVDALAAAAWRHCLQECSSWQGTAPGLGDRCAGCSLLRLIPEQIESRGFEAARASMLERLADDAETEGEDE